MFKNNGFTLIELMIVVVIIGVLLTVAVPSYTNQLHRAKLAKAVANLSEIRKANLSFYYTYGVVTNDIGTSLANEVGGGIAISDGDWSYHIAAFGNDTFTITATRLAGPYINDRIMLDEMENWTVNYSGPGSF